MFVILDVFVMLFILDSLFLLYVFLIFLAVQFSGRSQLQIAVRNASAAQATLRSILDSQISDIQQAGTWKSERVISTKQASEIAVQGRSDKLLNFCANNYLGLSVSYLQTLSRGGWIHDLLREESGEYLGVTVLIVV